MNTRLKLYLRRNLRNSEPGFALPLAILLGLLIVGGGIMMISLSQEDQSKAVTQKARSDGLMGTQAGLAQVQEYLNTVRVMAKYHSHYNTESTCDPKNKATCTPCTFDKTDERCWKSARVSSSNITDLTRLQKDLNALDASASCTNDPRAISNALDNMRGILTLEKKPITEDGNNKLFLYYRIEDYVYHKIDNSSSLNLTQHIGTGILTLTGLSSKSAWSANAATDNSESQNRLVVSLPVLASYPVAFSRTTVPALWIAGGGIENSGETGKISVANPTYSDGSKFQGDVVMSDPNAFADKKEDPDNVLRSKLECFINYGSVSEGSSSHPDNSQKKIVQPDPADPNVKPDYRAQFFPADEDKPSQPALNFPSLPGLSFTFLADLNQILDNPGQYKKENEATYEEYQRYKDQVNLDLKASTKFPRGGDKTITRKIDGQDVEFYEYQINNIELEDGETIQIDSSKGARVIFFVTGKIQFDGDSKIEHICEAGKECAPASFQIFASNSGEPKLPDPQICLPIGDGKQLAAFIFAPDYALGIQGGGQVKGAMWGKSWGKINGCQGNNSTGAIVQGVAWDDILVNKPGPLKELPQIGRIMAWCEEAIDTTDSKCVPEVIQPLGSQ